MKETLYFAPKSIEDALDLLDKYGEEASILAGGTDLVPRINEKKLKPGVLIYIGDLGLSYIKDEGNKIIIGAATTWTHIIMSPVIAGAIPVLCNAAKQGGTLSTRNAGTIGGNLANASPAADLAPPLLVLDASLQIICKSGARCVAANDFFIGPGKTMIKPDELIKEIHIPYPGGPTEFRKLGRRKAMTLSVVNTAVRLDLDDKDKGSSKRCAGAYIAVGSAAPTPLRCRRAEEMLKGNVLDKALILQCAVEAMNETSPIDDQRATAWYRKKAGAAVVASALAKAACINIE